MSVAGVTDRVGPTRGVRREIGVESSPSRPEGPAPHLVVSGVDPGLSAAGGGGQCVGKSFGAQRGHVLSWSRPNSCPVSGPRGRGGGRWRKTRLEGARPAGLHCRLQEEWPRVCAEGESELDPRDL